MSDSQKNLRKKSELLSYAELKRIVYSLHAFLGVVMILASIWQFHCMSESSGGASNFLTAVILLVVGGATLFFDVETWLLRDEPDIWQ